MKFSDSDFDYTDSDLLKFLGEQESQSIRWGHEYVEGLVDEFSNGQMMTGAKLPWDDTHDKIRFRPGEVTIHAGSNGNFKSMITGQMAQWFALQGEPSGIMSFEMPVTKTQSRMCRQFAGSQMPADDFIRRWAAWNNQNLAFYDKLDTTPSTRVLGALLYMVKDMGCRHIFIDSLTKCGLPYGERGPEKAFIDALCATAKASHSHIHLICHVRKPQHSGNEYRPSKYDVRGAGELTDLVDNVIIHWHDWKKNGIKQRQAAGHGLSTSELGYLDDNPDQRLIIEKQRHGEFQGTIGLIMDPSLQFYRGGRKLQPELPGD